MGLAHDALGSMLLTLVCFPLVVFGGIVDGAPALLVWVVATAGQFAYMFALVRIYQAWRTTREPKHEG